MEEMNLEALWAKKSLLVPEFFPRSPPLGWRLREGFGSKWARFYALPNGIRSVVEPYQKAEIILRFMEIALSLFGNPTKAISIIAPVRKFDGKYGRYQSRVLDKCGLYLVEKDFLDVEEDGETFDLYFASMPYNDKKVETLVIAIMEDKVMQTILISDDGKILAPYDGGFDVFGEKLEIGSLRKKFSNWASDRKDGL